jgi:hypothetical protein
MRNVSGRNGGENHYTFYIQYCSFPPENLAVYEITWKNNVESERPQMTIWRMRITWWIPKAINATSECAIIFVFHDNNGCPNVPECYVIRTRPALFMYL